MYMGDIMKKNLLKCMTAQPVRLFERDYSQYWARLSDATILLVILNISLFFLTELVTRQNYFYTFFSLFCLGIVQLGILLPLGRHNRLGYYLFFLALEFTGAYFLVSSAWYWVTTNRV